MSALCALATLHGRYSDQEKMESGAAAAAAAACLPVS